VRVLLIIVKMKKFYDIHMHAMDLSHANITAFASRLIQDTELDFQTWEKLGTARYLSKYIWANLIGKIGRNPCKKK